MAQIASDQPIARHDSIPSPAGRAARNRSIGVMAFTALTLAGVLTAAQLDSDAKGIGGLLRFREDGRGVETYGFVLLALSVIVVTLVAGLLVSGTLWSKLAVSADVAAKALLLLAVIFMFAFPDLSQFEGKSLTYRAILYPTLALGPTIVHLARRRPSAFPWVFDAFLTFVLVFDIVSNHLHYYGSWRHWDDGVHYANSVPMMVIITTAVMAVEDRGKVRLGFWGAFIFAFCIYTSVHALWEIEEFALDRFLGTNLQPGGMEEASRNNVAGLLGGLTTLPVLLWWRHVDTLTRIVRPVATLFARSPHAPLPV